jgi:hypothetical protein
MTNTITWKADLHNHLGSHGSNPGFDETIDMIHSTLGDYCMFGIANSDDKRYERFITQRGKYERAIFKRNLKDAVYVPEKKCLVIKCQEMFTEEGHILAIGTPFGYNIKTKKAEEAIKESKSLGAILCAVHPFYYQGIGLFLDKNPELFPYFSSWEIYNGSAEFSLPPVLPLKSNNKAADYCFDNGLMTERDLGISSFTDGHTPEVVGKCFTELSLSDDFYTRWNSSDLLDDALRSVKSLERLNREPNKKDSIVHTIKMGLVKLGLRTD